MKLQANQKLLFIGDSITDCGRSMPVGEGRSDGLGNGYVNSVDALLGAVYPQLPIRVINMGISGNTVTDLKARWQTDVSNLEPDWLSIMIGINDVWRQFDTPHMREFHVDPIEYQATLRELVKSTRPALKGMVLMTPFYIEPNSKNAMRARMDQYGAIVKKIAAEENAIIVDTQAAFNTVMQYQHPGNLALDRVHPVAIGHMVLAMAFLRAIGFAL